MGRKVALLIGVGQYREGSELPSLQCPMNGVHAVQEILNDAKIGGFDQVISLINPDVGTARRRVGEVFGSLTKDDLALFYFTGHGIKDMTGDFYLTTTETQLFADGRLNAGTALEAAFIKQEIGRSYAQRKVIILDCCFGGAFAEGFLTMDDGTMDVRAQLGGEGWVVLTAATSRNYALEQAGEPLSVYTRYLVEGLKTGTAAPENQAYISVGNLHDYVRAKVKTAAPTMEPSIFNGRQGEEIIIAKATAGDPELQYRKEVEAGIRQGNLPPAARAYLNVWRTKLGIASDRAKALEAEVLKPYQERQNHLNTYQKTLRAEIDYAFPLDSAAARDLQKLQKLLNLRDDDLRPVIATTLQSAQPGVAIDPITQFLLSDQPPAGGAPPTTSPQQDELTRRAQELEQSYDAWLQLQLLQDNALENAPAPGLAPETAPGTAPKTDSGELDLDAAIAAANQATMEASLGTRLSIDEYVLVTLADLGFSDLLDSDAGVDQTDPLDLDFDTEGLDLDALLNAPVPEGTSDDLLDSLNDINELS